ncbi:MAG: hypothetical protein ACOYT8_06175 [Candidatus Dependentiae bacterium]
MKLIYYLLIFGSLLSNNCIFTMEKEIPTLPSEIQIQEIVKQILNTSTTRAEAINTLNNYALTNKSIRQYIQAKKQDLNKLLKQRFGLSLEELASADYKNPTIKEETLRLLQEYESTTNHLGLKRVLENLIDSVKKERVTTNFMGLNNFILRPVINTKKYPLIAAVLGAIKNLGDASHEDTPLNKAEYTQTLKYFISQFKNNKPVDDSVRKILNLFVSVGNEIFGNDFINEWQLSTDFPGSVIEYAQTINNPTIVKYLKSNQ